MVESALIPKLPNFNSSEGFYSLPDNIAQHIISELHIITTDPFLYFNIHVALLVRSFFYTIEQKPPSVRICFVIQLILLLTLIFYYTSPMQFFRVSSTFICSIFIHLKPSELSLGPLMNHTSLCKFCI